MAGWNGASPLGNWSRHGRGDLAFSPGLSNFHLQHAFFWGPADFLGWDGERNACGGKAVNEKKLVLKIETQKSLLEGLNAHCFNWM